MLCYETPQVTMAWNNTGTAVLVNAATEVGDLRLRNVIFTSKHLGSGLSEALCFFRLSNWHSFQNSHGLFTKSGSNAIQDFVLLRNPHHKEATTGKSYYGDASLYFLRADGEEAPLLPEGCGLSSWRSILISDLTWHTMLTLVPFLTWLDLSLRIGWKRGFFFCRRLSPWDIAPKGPSLKQEKGSMGYAAACCWVLSVT